MCRGFILNHPVKCHHFSAFEKKWSVFCIEKNKTHKEVEMKENCLLLQMYLSCEFSLGLLWIWLLKWEWQPNNRRTLCLPAALCCFHFIFNLWPNSYELIQVYLQSICFLWEYEGILFVCLFFTREVLPNTSVC